jgi:hypothetical protein
MIYTHCLSISTPNKPVVTYALAMLKALATPELRDDGEPLLPKEPPKPRDGRPHIDNCAYLRSAARAKVRTADPPGMAKMCLEAARRGFVRRSGGRSCGGKKGHLPVEPLQPFGKGSHRLLDLPLVDFSLRAPNYRSLRRLGPPCVGGESGTAPVPIARGQLWPTPVA